MNIQTLAQSPRNHRGGQVSHLLLGAGQFGSENFIPSRKRPRLRQTSGSR